MCDGFGGVCCCVFFSEIPDAQKCIWATVVVFYVVVWLEWFVEKCLPGCDNDD